MATKTSEERDDPKAHLMSMIKDFSAATLVTRAPEGKLHGRPMELADVDADGAVWFATSIDSTKVEEISKDPQAMIAMQNPRKYVMLYGHAEVHRDPEKISQLWEESFRIWYGDKTDPELALLKFVPHEAEYWDISGVRGLKYALRAAKAYVTGDKSVARNGGEDNHAKLAL